ncbi:MAG: non-heme iron oxygenase ferredoxin subunit [Gemmataceae bacterium]
MPFVTVASARDVPPGRGTLVEADGRKVALFCIDGRYYALDNACPHRGASLALGSCASGEVHCPLHDARFELATGRHLSPPAKSDVRSYPVRVQGDEVQVEFDALATASPAPQQPADAAPKGKKRVRVEETTTIATGPFWVALGLVIGAVLASVAWAGARYLELRGLRQEMAKLKDELDIAKQQAVEPAAPLLVENKVNPEDVKRIYELGDSVIEDLRAKKTLSTYLLHTPEFQKAHSQKVYEERLAQVTALEWIVQSPTQRSTKVRRSGTGYEYLCFAPIAASNGMIQIAIYFVPIGDQWRIEKIQFAQDK